MGQEQPFTHDHFRKSFIRRCKNPVINEKVHALRALQSTLKVRRSPRTWFRLLGILYLSEHKSCGNVVTGQLFNESINTDYSASPEGNTAVRIMSPVAQTHLDLRHFEDKGGAPGTVVIMASHFNCADQCTAWFCEYISMLTDNTSSCPGQRGGAAADQQDLRRLRSHGFKVSPVEGTPRRTSSRNRQSGRAQGLQRRGQRSRAGLAHRGGCLGNSRHGDRGRI